MLRFAIKMKKVLNLVKKKKKGREGEQQPSPSPSQRSAAAAAAAGAAGGSRRESLASNVIAGIRRGSRAGASGYPTTGT